MNNAVSKKSNCKMCLICSYSSLWKWGLVASIVVWNCHVTMFAYGWAIALSLEQLEGAIENCYRWMQNQGWEGHKCKIESERKHICCDLATIRYAHTTSYKRYTYTTSYKYVELWGSTTISFQSDKLNGNDLYLVWWPNWYTLTNTMAIHAFFSIRPPLTLPRRFGGRG
jgi:hypothetical protein